MSSRCITLLEHEDLAVRKEIGASLAKLVTVHEFAFAESVMGCVIGIEVSLLE